MKTHALLLTFSIISILCISQITDLNRLQHFDDPIKYELYDFDTDGDQDILVYNEINQNHYELGVLEFISIDSTLEYHTLVAVKSINYDFFVKDYNGNGLLEIIYAAKSIDANINTINHIEVNSDFSINTHKVIDTLLSPPSRIAVIDYNQNLFPDLYLDFTSSLQTSNLVYKDISLPNQIQVDTLNDQITGHYNKGSSFDYIDVDVDGTKDLVWTESNYSVFATDSIFWLKGISTGGFVSSKQLLLAGNASERVWGDFDGDGDQDLAFSGYYQLAFFENNNGLLTSHSFNTATNFSKLISTDYNQDGKDDLIAGNNNGIEILQSIGNFNFNSQWTYNMDFVNFSIVSSNSSIIELMINSGNNANILHKEEFFLVEIINLNTTKTKQIHSQTSHVDRIEFRDFDLDGDIDYLATGDNWSHNINIQKNNGKFVWKSNIPRKSSNNALILLENYKLGDIDGDSLTDIITSISGVSSPNNHVVWFKNLGDGKFSDQSTIIDNSHNFNCERLIVTDLDGDGDNDIVTADHSNGDVYMWWNNGNGLFSNIIYVGSTSSNNYLVSGDIITGGEKEILIHAPNNKTDVYEYDGINWNLSNTSSVNYSMHNLELIDIDNDGDLDLVGGHKQYDNSVFSYSKISISENYGFNQFSSSTSLFIPDEPFVDYAFFDHNGDSSPDLVTIEKYNAGIYENQGNYTFNSSHDISFTAGYGAYGGVTLGIADFDADGDQDVAFSLGGSNNNNSSPNLYLGRYDNSLITTSCSLNLNVDSNNNILTSLSTGGTYQWIDCSTNLIIPNETSQSFSPSSPGNYAVEVTINNCIDTSVCTLINYCSISANYTIINNGNGNYSFTNNSSGNYTNTHWSFGDGYSSSLSSLNHTFSTNGTYIIVLTVGDSTNGNLCFDYFLDTITVSNSPNQLQCNAGFVVFPDTNTNNITILNSAIGQNLSYLWDFGDGTTSNNQFPNHTYDSSTTYQVCLTIDDGLGCNSTYCDSIGENGIILKAASNGFTINVMQADVASNIEDEQPLLPVKLFPNPAINELSIISDLKINSINILSATGKLLKVIKSDYKKIDLHDLPRGIYFAKILIEEQVIIKKIVLK